MDNNTFGAIVVVAIVIGVVLVKIAQVIGDVRKARWEAKKIEAKRPVPKTAEGPSLTQEQGNGRSRGDFQPYDPTGQGGY